MDNVIVICGPTASGKSSVAVEVALKYNGEVISADSMQIYKHFDIGTAKITPEEAKGVKHHMIDIIEPHEEFNVVRYKEMAISCIDDIISRGKTPVIAGGTGFYINSIIYDEQFQETVKNDEFREKLEQEAKIYGNEYLHNKLKEIDPKAAENIHMNNVKRVIRALEVYEFTNKRFSDSYEPNKTLSDKYNFILIGLNPDRSYLYDRINKRVDKMIEDGLLEETKELYFSGKLEGKTASASIGYKELIPYIKGEVDLKTAIDKLKQVTRNYAKRQITWFKRVEEIKQFNFSEDDSYEIILQNIFNYIDTKLIG